MKREFTATGATVEEAIENACRELGVSPDDVTPEILRFPKKGFLGIGKVDAEVRITIDNGEEAPKPVKKAANPPKQQPAPKQPKPAVTESPAPKKEKAEIPAVPQEPKQDLPKPETVQPAPEKTVEEPKCAEEPKPAAEESAPKEEISLEQLQPKMDVAVAYLTEIFAKMGIQDIQIRMEPAENRTVLIHLDGGDIGSVIGKRGETLDAIQYLVSLAANRSEGDYVRFTINAGNYREKREETLRALAQRMAKKVLKTGRPAALEPMNPYERRIIHAVVTDIEGVFSKSTGEEPNRKVVIKPTAKPASSRRDSGKRSSRNRSRGPRNNETAENSELLNPAAEQPAVPAPEKSEPVVMDDNIKLYTKIEL
ncbi:MAG: RNA-binding cell elongation regulator Jag/EloR [Candidatus Merdivicinus sp.]